MNLPTKITVSRLVLVPVLVVLFLVDFSYHYIIATGVFALASLTDFLDGYLARKNNMVTTLGNFLDTVADKVLVSCSLVLIATLTTVNPVYQSCIVACAAIITARELIIMCLKTLAATKNTIIVADKLGKVKMAVQIVGLFFYMPFAGVAELNALAGDIFFYTGFSLMMIATLLTIISAINYLIKNKHVLKEE